MVHREILAPFVVGPDPVGVQPAPGVLGVLEGGAGVAIVLGPDDLPFLVQQLPVAPGGDSELVAFHPVSSDPLRVRLIPLQPPGVLRGVGEADVAGCLRYGPGAVGEDGRSR